MYSNRPVLAEVCALRVLLSWLTDWLIVTWSVEWQVRLSVSSMSSSRWARDNSWYGNVCGGELKSPQMMTAGLQQLSNAEPSPLMQLLLFDDDVTRANSSSSLTASDACHRITPIQYRSAEIYFFLINNCLKCVFTFTFCPCLLSGTLSRQKYAKCLYDGSVCLVSSSTCWTRVIDFIACLWKMFSSESDETGEWMSECYM